MDDAFVIAHSWQIASRKSKQNAPIHELAAETMKNAVSEEKHTTIRSKSSVFHADNRFEIKETIMNITKSLCQFAVRVLRVI